MAVSVAICDEERITATDVIVMHIYIQVSIACHNRLFVRKERVKLGLEVRRDALQELVSGLLKR